MKYVQFLPQHRVMIPQLHQEYKEVAAEDVSVKVVGKWDSLPPSESSTYSWSPSKVVSGSTSKVILNTSSTEISGSWSCCHSILNDV